jgi:hypothetical protein
MLGMHAGAEFGQILCHGRQALALDPAKHNRLFGGDDEILCRRPVRRQFLPRGRAAHTSRPGSGEIKLIFVTLTIQSNTSPVQGIGVYLNHLVNSF